MGHSQPFRPSTEEAPPGTDSSGSPFWVRAGCLLAWLGVWLCFLLLQKESALRSFFCPLRGGCETALGSQFASVRGIPLPWLGAGYYLVLLGLWLAVSGVRSLRWRNWLVDSVLWLALAGLTFSLGLMYVQFAVVRAFCPLCTGSAVTVAASALVAFRARRVATTSPTGASLGNAVTLAVFAVLPLIIFLAGNLVAPEAPGRLWLLDLSAAHRLGPASAPVQIVIYSDFQCGFCRQLAPVLQKVESEFPQDVTLVYRHFPLAVHPRAFAAAVASECAAEQGAFWKYHDALFAEGGDLGDARLLALAVSLGLDEQRFKACLNSERPRRIVEENLREASELALPGAPSVFVNGRQIQGPVTYEKLSQQIRELLAKAGRRASPKE